MNAILDRIVLVSFFLMHAFIAIFSTEPGRRLVRLDLEDDAERKRFLANRSSKVGDQS